MAEEWKPPHYCDEWDGMWITKYSLEWSACICKFAPPRDGEEHAHREYLRALEADRDRIDLLQAHGLCVDWEPGEWEVLTTTLVRLGRGSSLREAIDDVSNGKAWDPARTERPPNG